MISKIIYRNFASAASVAPSRSKIYRNFIPSSHFIYISQDIDEQPTLAMRFQKQDEQFYLDGQTTLKSLEQNMRQKFGSQLKTINFQAPDGVEISKLTTFKNVCQIPFFIMRYKT